MKSKTKWLATIATLAVVFVLVLSLGLSTIFASADVSDEALAKAGRYYGDFTSQEQVDEAKEQMNVSLAEEGMVLLKNDGTLPLAKGARVSVLGIAQDVINETTGSVTESLADAGFNVNPTLAEYYLNDDATYHDYGEEPSLSAAQKSSLSLYSDAAVVVIGRGAPGESEDRELATEEVDDETYLGDITGWTHEAHETSGEDSSKVSYKHELQLTDSEEEMILLAEQTCKKVIVLYTSSYVFEMYNLEQDDSINAIAWIGRLGDGGIVAVGEMLSGAIDPSGKTVDEWMRDFTADPTYANVYDTAYTEGSGADAKTSSYSGMDYEEDIYLGYKFYETYWYENGGKYAFERNTQNVSDLASANEWYDANVVYPFGYGLSYTDFSYELVSVTTNGSSAASMDLTTQESNSISADDLSTSSKADLSTAVTTMTAKVKVTNTGYVSGRETVEIYMETPYGVKATGADRSCTGTEKSYLTLVGFGKTGELQPGRSETVEITFNMQDVASYDYADMNGDGHKGYELDCGDYTMHVMESSSHENITDESCEAYASCSFSVTTTTTHGTAAHLDVDDFSGNKVENIFSGSQETGDTPSDAWKDDYYTMAISADTGTMISPIEVAADATSATTSTMLSRSDAFKTMPTAPGENEGTLSEDALALLAKYQKVDADTFEYDTEGYPWYHGVEDLAGWTQDAAGKDSDGDGVYDITLDDMAGVALYDETGAISSKWVEFMNQLTWEEMCYLLEYGSHHTAEMTDIGKGETWDENGPNYTADTDLCWCGEPTVAATWNQDLCEQYGILVANVALWQGMTGWYGPGLNTHRSAFSGRSPEYYSQDGIQGGYIGAAVVGGASSRGINVNVKHFALYDIGEIRGDGCVNISEQNMRENYLKPFQMAMQEGDAHAAMCAFNRVGSVYACQNYALLQALARDEWGWTGYAMTDATGSIPYMTMDGLVRGGCQLPDSDYTSGSSVLSGTWSADYDWSSDTTYGSAYNTTYTGENATNAPVGAVLLNDGTADFASPTQWYLVRMGATYILYSQCNSAGNYNGLAGIDSDTHGLIWNATGNGTQGQDINIDLVTGSSVDRDEHIISNAYVVEGTLPSGLVMEDGYLTGTIYDAEDLAFTVEVIVDGWIKMEVEVTIANSAIVTVRNDVSDLAVGDSVSTYVQFDSSDVAFTDDVSFAIVDGALPTGLTLNSENGRLSGTVSAEGTYTFTVGVTATNPDDVILVISQSSIDLVAGTFGMSDEAVIEMVKWSDFWQDYLGAYTLPATSTYYMTYTISVAEAASGSGDTSTGDTSTGSGDASTGGTTGSVDTSSESSGGNGLAIAALVLAIVAIVAAAVVLVVVLLKRNKKSDNE